MLAICAGIGGAELGLKLACPTTRCVCYVEGEAYAASILVQRMEEGWLDQAPIWSNVRTFDGKPWRGVVDTITAGYPCQPFSTAGPMRGSEDPRHLWPEVKRIINEVQPRIVFLENVANHLRMGGEQVHDDLFEMGYEVRTGLFTAEEVGAPHQRRRLFLLAYAPRPGAAPFSAWRGMAGSGDASALMVSEGEERRDNDRQERHGADATIKCGMGDKLFPQCPKHLGQADIKSCILRGTDGAASWVDRTRAVGNSVSPLVAAYAFRTLAATL